MGTWTEEQWKSGDGKVDEEHRKLHQMITSMAAVIRNDRGLGMGGEAVDVLAERLRLHFRMEEKLAEQGATAPEIAHLKQDHSRLLRLLEPLRAAAAAGRTEECARLMAQFQQELDTHDRQVDIPLFRASGR